MAFLIREQMTFYYFPRCFGLRQLTHAEHPPTNCSRRCASNTGLKKAVYLEYART
jgi:hypothetical protein